MTKLKNELIEERILKMFFVLDKSKKTNHREEREHIVYCSEGRTNSFFNLTLSCQECNENKNNK